jgi:hypothetical protein
LTTKFTRHTAASPLAFSHQPSAISKNHHTPLKLYGPLLLLIARLTPINVYAHQQLLSGTHKNLRRLVFTQSIQLSNIVLVNQLSAVSFQPSAKNFQPTAASLTPPWRVWVLLTPGCANPGIPPTQCSAPGDFH